MSCEERRIVFEKVEIKIDTLTKSKVLEIENAIVKCLSQKEEKINIILKNLNVSEVSGCLFIQDRYCVAKDLIEISKAFGMAIKQVQCTKKGKCYLLSDPLVAILRILQSDYHFGQSISNTEGDAEISALISANKFDFSEVTTKYGTVIAKAVDSLKKYDFFKIEGQSTIEETWYEGIFVDSHEVAFQSDRARVESELKNFLKNVDKQLQTNNRNMQNGTTELLYSRAKQMGYSVQKERKGDQIQLVMVRLQ